MAVYVYRVYRYGCLCFRFLWWFLGVYDDFDLWVSMMIFFVGVYDDFVWVSMMIFLWWFWWWLLRACYTFYPPLRRQDSFSLAFFLMTLLLLHTIETRSIAILVFEDITSVTQELWSSDSWRNFMITPSSILNFTHWNNHQWPPRVTMTTIPIIIWSPTL